MKFEVAAAGWLLFSQTFVLVFVLVFVRNLILVSRLRFEVATVWADRPQAILRADPRLY